MKEFLEKSLEDVIFDSASEKFTREILESHGLKVEGKLFRQVDLRGFGRLDLVSVYIGRKESNGKRLVKIDVYELKKDMLTVGALLQASRYLSCIKALFDDEDIHQKYNFEWKVTLIGRNVDSSSDLLHLISLFGCDIRVLTYDISLDGIFFRRAKLETCSCKCEILFDFTEKLSHSDIRELLNVIYTDMPF